MAKGTLLRKIFLGAALLVGAGGGTASAQTESVTQDSTTQTQTVTQDKPWANDPDYVRRLENLKAQYKSEQERIANNKKFQEEQAKLDRKISESEIEAYEQSAYMNTGTDLIAKLQIKLEADQRRERVKIYYDKRMRDIKYEADAQTLNLEKNHGDAVAWLDNEFAQKDKYKIKDTTPKFRP